MDRFKKPEMLLTLIALTFLIVTTVYFYRRHSSVEGELDKLVDLLAATTKKVRETDIYGTQIKQLEAGTQELNSHIRNQTKAIQECQFYIEHIAENIELLSEAMRSVGLDVQLRRYDGGGGGGGFRVGGGMRGGGGMGRDVGGGGMGRDVGGMGGGGMGRDGGMRGDGGGTGRDGGGTGRDVGEMRGEPSDRTYDRSYDRGGNNDYDRGTGLNRDLDRHSSDTRKQDYVSDRTQPRTRVRSPYDDYDEDDIAATVSAVRDARR